MRHHRLAPLTRATRRPGVPAALVVVLGVLALPAAAPLASSGNVAVDDIKIVGTPVLYVQRPVSSHTYNAAWVIFRTSPHLHEARQVVVELKGRSGRSFGNAGARNCVRSTIIQVARLVKPGATYRVRFYGRARVGGDRTLLRTYALAAHRFASSPRNPSSPRCSS
jgi:hypothetical protein